MDARTGDAKDKVFLVTGGTSGVGRAIATGLARQGSKVVIVGRTSEGGRKAADEIARQTRNERIEYLVADLSLRSAIETLTETYTSTYGRLDALVNAAGAIIFDKAVTSEGQDLSLAVNYLSHFSITTLMLDILKATNGSRVLTVAGNPKYLVEPDLQLDGIEQTGEYNALNATLQATLARVYFSFELARRLGDSNVASLAFHPGLVRSNLIRHAPLAFRLYGLISNLRAARECDVGVWLASAPEAQSNGSFFDNKRKRLPVSKAFDPVIGERLWTLSEELVRDASS